MTSLLFVRFSLLAATRSPLQPRIAARAHCLLSVVARTALALLVLPGPVLAQPGVGSGDLRPIAAAQWNADAARHLLERAGFGGTPQDIARLAAMTPQEAVRSLVEFPTAADALAPFDESGTHDPGLEPFPPSRPAATDLARKTGEVLGVKVRPDGNRRLQPVADRFFYWLRASRLETQRMAYWWANRMLVSPYPLQEKMALFWHGHFTSSEDKIRDYRKLLKQNALFRQMGTGSFRDLMIAVAQDPAMLAYLDAGVNVKGSPNENFAREIMEMFTMGVGHYSEHDIREAARAFTGWNFRDLDFVIDKDRHDDGVKTVLGRSGNFDGVQVIDIILAQPATADFLAGKIYRYFVRDELSPALQRQLGAALRDGGYRIAPLLETIFLSRDFYSDAAVGTRIKPPVELVVSTYRKLGLQAIPGVPDFNAVTESMGQKLFYPPTVAGWANGSSWVTPGLLLVRGNFGYDVLFPDVGFVAPDRHPGTSFQDIVAVGDKLARGLDVTSATRSDQKAERAMSNQMADRDEDFNTRLASYHGWQSAIEKVKPIPRTTAPLALRDLVRADGAVDAAGAVDALLRRFLSVKVDDVSRARLVAFLTAELGTTDLQQARGYAEPALRATLHLILSLPDYQLG